MQIAGFDEFELDLEHAFKRDLPPFIDTLTAAQLTDANVLLLPSNKNGVYLLLQNQDVVYVGKTDSKAGFQARLSRHASHIKHRKGLDPQSIFFKAVAIPVFKNADLESILIDHYGASWNNSGFGSNDPGVNRDTQDPADFDKNFPIDVNIPLDFIHNGEYKAVDLLKALSSNLPYTFRYQKQGHQEEFNFSLKISNSPLTMKDILMLLINYLPEKEWQATVLLGRVILYRENKGYEFSQEIIR